MIKDDDNLGMLSIDIKKNLKEKYVDRYVKEFKNGNWSQYRDKGSERFIIEEKEIKFIGKKKIYNPIVEDANLNLQESRGIGISDDTTLENILQDVKNKINHLAESDLVRIKELDSFISSHFKETKFKKFLEIGFRIPKIQTYYRERFGFNDCGIDINNFNVEIFSNMGFNCHRINLMENNSIHKSLNSKFDLICCYHVLEHVANPYESVKNIFDSLNEDGVLHVEIPVEPGIPRLEYGHLISYNPSDMLRLLKGVGFNVISATNTTHDGGPWIERYIAIKK